mgnify:CR=1 FL=1|jgi:hypothetical protein
MGMDGMEVADAVLLDARVPFENTLDHKEELWI